MENYYVSADAALELCEVARREKYFVLIERRLTSPDWFVAFSDSDGDDRHSASNQSLPAAITEAFLKWKGKL